MIRALCPCIDKVTLLNQQGNPMKKLTFLNTLVLLAITSLASNYSVAQSAQNNFFVDLLILQDGKTQQDANRYFEKVAPIAARHGLVRIHEFSVSTIFTKGFEPDLVNLWTMAHGDVFKNINQDPDYKKMIPTRNALFDMKASHMSILDQH